MKSIKEKADEHAPYTENDSWDKIQRCMIAQTSFEAGANYVLKEIEEFMKHNLVHSGNLKRLIEQLKEK